MASKRNEGLAALAALLMSSRSKGGNDPISELLEGATFGVARTTTSHRESATTGPPSAEA
jgi:hypothetical protein